MTHEKKPWHRDGKNIVILCLVLLNLVQFLALRPAPAPAPDERAPVAAPSGDQTAKPAPNAENVEAIGVFLEPVQGRSLLLVLDRPVPDARPGQIPAKAPATIAPPVPGKWTWQNAFMLRFEATDAFKPMTRYVTTIAPENFLPASLTFSGRKDFDVSWGSFDVDKIEASFAPWPEDKTMAVVSGTVSFNQPVDPRTLTDFFKITDPLRGPNDPVPYYFTTTYASKRLSFESDPVPRDAQKRDLTLTVAAGLTPRNGNVKLQEARDQSLSVFLDPNLRVDRMEGESYEGASSIAIGLSAPVAPDAAEAAIRITPETPFKVLSDGLTLRLTGDFVPGREYVVKAAKGLTAEDGAVLGQNVENAVLIPDLPPRVDFRDQGMFLSRDGYKNLALNTVNTDSAQVVVDRVYRNNLFSLFNFDYSAGNDVYSNDYLNHSLGDRIFSERLTVPFTLNKTETTPFSLGEVIREAEPGLYRVGVQAPGQYEGFQRWVLITDLGLIAKKGVDEILVYAASLKDLSSQAGVTLRVVSDQNQELAKGVTDASGLWRAKIPAKTLEKNQPFLITAEKGADFTFLLFDKFRIDSTGLDVGGKTVSGSGYAAFLYGERDIYRPGEVLNGMAVVRDARLETPPPLPLTLRQKDPRGRKIDERALTSDAGGMVPFSLPLPRYLMTGPYSLELLAGEDVIGSYRFQAEEFTPDRINVRVEPGEKAAAPGKPLPFSVKSRYLFGPPAAGMDVEATVRLTKAPFAPKGFENYSFGDPERSFEDQDLMEEEGALDDEGLKTFSLTLPENLKPPAALSAVITARVREGGGRGVAAMAAVPTHAYPYYPGIKRLDSDGVDPGKPVACQYAVVAPDGKKTKGGPLKALFYKDNWQTTLRRSPSGDFKYESVRDARLLESKNLAAADSGSFSFTPPTFGSYRAVLTDPATGATSQIEFYAGGFGYSPWAVENPARIDLVPDKESYAAGEVARFQVRAPFPGRLLATVENGAVKDVQILDLTGNTGEIRVPVKTEYMPNVYLTAVLVRKATDVEPGAPSRAYGAASVFVERESGRISPVVTAPAEMRPLSPLEVEVATDPGADVTVAMVDEGILQLIAQKTPDPFADFYAKRALAVDSYDAFALLLPETPPLLGKALAGGGDGLDLSKFIRSESPAAKSVVYWSGLLRADASGKVTARFDVPEFQGAVRIMAVSASGRRFGSAEATTRVKSPLSVSPTLPRVLSFGDALQLPVTVRNDSDKAGEFTVKLAASGPATVETPSLSLNLGPGKEGLVRFPVTAHESEGVVSFTVTAEGGGESARYAAELLVRSPLPAASLVRSGALDKASTALADASSDFLPESVRRSAHIGRQPLIRYAGNLKDLLRYPYGCVEQTVSRAFPLLYFSELALVLDPKAFEKSSPQAMVQSAIRRLASMQIYDGGFAMWPEGTESFGWGSVYAAHFLVEAQRAGYQVDREMVTDVLRYLGRMAKETEEVDPSDLKRMAYALFVLARAGWADVGSMDYLRDNLVPQMSSDAKALLGAAYAATGNMRVAGDLLAAKTPADKGRDLTDPNFDSPLRNQALFLSTLLDAAPKDPRIPKLAEEVGRSLSATRRPSTQENAFSLMALGKYFAAQRAKKPFAGKLYAGQTPLGAFSSESPLSLEGITDPGELRVEMDSGYEPGAAYFSVATRGVPKVQGYKPEAKGLTVTRRYLDRNGQALAETRVPQGALLVMEAVVRSPEGAVDNLAVENLLPAGLEVENPRLETTEKLPWVTDNDLEAAYLDLRDDRILLFTSVADDKPHKYYALVRAVAPGTFVSPPEQVEAMYAPELRASGELGSFTVEAAK